MTNAPTTLTKAQTVPGALGAIGDADALKAAFETGAQITLDGKFGGERVYLGYRRQVMGDDGVTMERVGLDQVIGETPKFPGIEIAVYLVDLDRLDDAPRLAEIAAKQRNASMGRYLNAEARAEQDERRYLGPEAQ